MEDDDEVSGAKNSTLGAVGAVGAAGTQSWLNPTKVYLA